MPAHSGLDTGSKFTRRENEQTSGMVLNHGKRFEWDNCTGVDRWYHLMVLTAIQAMSFGGTP